MTKDDLIVAAHDTSLSVGINQPYLSMATGEETETEIFPDFEQVEPALGGAADIA